MKTEIFKSFTIFSDSIESIKHSTDQVVINTINAHSYIVSKEDELFRESLEKSDILLPDGEGVVVYLKIVGGKVIKKISGAEIHEYLLNYANDNNLNCFYLGSSQSTLDKLKVKLTEKYPKLNVGFYSPPFKDIFSDEDNIQMAKAANDFDTDILFVGMTAPKQEKWVFNNRSKLNSKIIVSIGAVFDFYTGNIKRAPQWMINVKLEWFHRALSSWRLTKRYMYSTPLFVLEIIKDKFITKKT